MNTIKILIKKELSSSFHSWSLYLGYIIFFCVCGFYSWFSPHNLFYIGQANMAPVFVIINWCQLILIPILTMRSIAEDKRNGTIELMLTKPIKTMELIMGKFCSYFIISNIAILFTIPYYITLSILGDVDHGSIFLGYIGLITISACYISIVLFASALARTAITAFFISLGIGLCFQLLFDILAQQIRNDFISSFFSYLSINEHVDTIARGIFDSRDLIYFSSICIIFLMLSKLFICKSRF